MPLLTGDQDALQDFLFQDLLPSWWWSVGSILSTTSAQLSSHVAYPQSPGVVTPFLLPL